MEDKDKEIEPPYNSLPVFSPYSPHWQPESESESTKICNDDTQKDDNDTQKEDTIKSTAPHSYSYFGYGESNLELPRSLGTQELRNSRD